MDVGWKGESFLHWSAALILSILRLYLSILPITKLQNSEFDCWWLAPAVWFAQLFFCVMTCELGPAGVSELRLKFHNGWKQRKLLALIPGKGLWPKVVDAFKILSFGHASRVGTQAQCHQASLRATLLGLCQAVGITFIVWFAKPVWSKHYQPETDYSILLEIRKAVANMSSKMQILTNKGCIWLYSGNIVGDISNTLCCPQVSLEPTQLVRWFSRIIHANLDLVRRFPIQSRLMNDPKGYLRVHLFFTSSIYGAGT